MDSLTEILCLAGKRRWLKLFPRGFSPLTNPDNILVQFFYGRVWPVCHFHLVRWEIEKRPFCNPLILLTWVWDDLLSPSSNFANPFKNTHKVPVDQTNIKSRAHLLVLSSWNWIDLLIPESKPKMQKERASRKEIWNSEISFPNLFNSGLRRPSYPFSNKTFQ